MLSKPNYINFNVNYADDFGDYHSPANELKRMYDLRLRAYCEFNRCVQRGERCYFFTLTFSNKHIKHFKCDMFDLLVMDWEKVNKFVKNVKNFILEKYNIVGTTYLIASELGDKKKDSKGNKRFRPHLHMIITFPSWLTPETVYSIIKRYWNYGYILPRVPGQWNESGKYVGTYDRHGRYHRPILIDNEDVPFACVYASKYALKKVKYNSCPKYDECMQYLESTHQNSKIAEFKAGLPKIKTSLRFGQSIEEVVFSSENPLRVCFEGLDIPAYSDKKVKLTQYTKRRLFFTNKLDRIEDTPTKKVYRYVRERTQFYHDYRRYNFHNLIIEKEKYVKDFMCVFLGAYDSFDELYADIDKDDIRFIQGFTKVNALAVYMHVYRNRISPLHYFDFTQNPDKYKYIESIFSKRYYWSYYRNAYGAEKKKICMEKIDWRMANSYIPVIADRSYLPCNYRHYHDVSFFPDGSESLDHLVSLAKRYDDYLSDVTDSFASLPSYVGDHWNLYFNSFAPFLELERFINIMQVFYANVKNYNAEETIKAILEQRTEKNTPFACEL